MGEVGDLAINLMQPLKGLAGQRDGRFWTSFCDGSARAISDRLDPETMTRRLQINDGEVVGDFQRC